MSLRDRPLSYRKQNNSSEKANILNIESQLLKKSKKNYCKVNSFNQESFEPWKIDNPDEWA